MPFPLPRPGRQQLSLTGSSVTVCKHSLPFTSACPLQSTPHTAVRVVPLKGKSEPANPPLPTLKPFWGPAVCPAHCHPLSPSSSSCSKHGFSRVVGSLPPLFFRSQLRCHFLWKSSCDPQWTRWVLALHSWDPCLLPITALNNTSL